MYYISLLYYIFMVHVPFLITDVHVGRSRNAPDVGIVQPTPQDCPRRCLMTWGMYRTLCWKKGSSFPLRIPTAPRQRRTVIPVSRQPGKPLREIRHWKRFWLEVGICFNSYFNNISSGGLWWQSLDMFRNVLLKLYALYPILRQGSLQHQLQRLWQTTGGVLGI